jgi:hypothetical protein
LAEWVKVRARWVWAYFECSVGEVEIWDQEKDSCAAAMRMKMPVTEGGDVRGHHVGEMTAGIGSTCFAREMRELEMAGGERLVAGRKVEN